jgi:endoglucanase
MNTLILMALLSTNNEIRLSWESVPLIYYCVSATPSISGQTTTWAAVTNVIGTGKSINVNLSTPSSERYYKVSIEDKPLGNPLFGKTFYVDPNGAAAKQAVAWAVTNPVGAAKMQKIAKEPQGIWLASSSSPNTALSVSTAAKLVGAMPILPAYYIPKRDCKGFSNGGAPSAAAYLTWTSNVWKNLATQSLILLEPDALALINTNLNSALEPKCLSPAEEAERYDLIRQAGLIYKKENRALVYLDGGHSKWQKDTEMARRLKLAGVDNVDGFFLNVSNFQTTKDCIDFGTRVSKLLGGKHFIIDTGRNGKGQTSNDPNWWWCNPEGAGLGLPPTTITGNSLVDMFGWFKPPGQSDGPHPVGAPNPGIFWPKYAEMLVDNAAY